MKSIIIGNAKIADPKQAAQMIADINNIPFEDAVLYMIGETVATDEFITKTKYMNISDLEYIKMYLEEDAQEDIIFLENEGLEPIQSKEEFFSL